MFITLTDAEKGTPISLNVAHIRSITPADSGVGSVVAAPVGSFAGTEWVTEAPEEILATIARLSSTAVPKQLTDAEREAAAARIAQHEINAYADNLEAEEAPGFRMRANVWRDIITAAAYHGIIEGASS